MAEHPISIAGAGLAGALLAVLLARRGFAVTVYERRPDLRKVAIAAGRSINLALANRGIAALRAAGVMDRVEPLLIPMRGRMLHLASGETTLSPYGQRDDEVIFSVSRGDLNGVLLDAAEETGRVDLRFEAQRSDGADTSGVATLLRVRFMMCRRDTNRCLQTCCTPVTQQTHW